MPYVLPVRFWQARQWRSDAFPDSASQTTRRLPQEQLAVRAMEVSPRGEDAGCFGGQQDPGDVLPLPVAGIRTRRQFGEGFHFYPKPMTMVLWADANPWGAGWSSHCSEKNLHRYLAEVDFREGHRIALGVDDQDRSERLWLARG